MTPETPFDGQFHVIHTINQMMEARKPIKDLEVLINAKIDPALRHHLLGSVGLFEITALAIDALSEGDPAYLKEIYNNGGKIEDDIVGDLATAIIWSKRRNTDSLDEFIKLRKRRR